MSPIEGVVEDHLQDEDSPQEETEESVAAAVAAAAAAVEEHHGEEGLHEEVEEEVEDEVTVEEHVEEHVEEQVEDHVEEQIDEEEMDVTEASPPPTPATPVKTKSTKLKPPSHKAYGLKILVKAAAKIRDTSERDVALITALRGCREELETAEEEAARVEERLTAAKDVYEFAAKTLAGYSTLDERRGSVGGRGRGRKRFKRDSSDSLGSPIMGVKYEDDGSAKGRPGPSVMENNMITLPDNPVILPAIHTSGGGMSFELVAIHRESFYQKLLGVSAANVDTYNPPPNHANLKSKQQLREWVFIAEHWNTGVDGVDAGAFRAKNKTWYSRMKPVSENLGRRTGIHLRTLDADFGAGNEAGETVLCRYAKDGIRSIVYLNVEQLFDALFEIHTLELSHRGRDSVKARVDELYANIPDGQVRTFIDTCPICAARRGTNAHQRGF